MVSGMALRMASWRLMAFCPSPAPGIRYPTIAPKARLPVSSTLLPPPSTTSP